MLHATIDTHSRFGSIDVLISLFAPVSLPYSHQVHQISPCNVQKLLHRRVKLLALRQILYDNRDQTNAVFDERIEAIRSIGGDTSRLEYERWWFNVLIKKVIDQYNSGPIDVYEASWDSLNDCLGLTLIALKAQSALLVDEFKSLFERLMGSSDKQFLAIVDPPTPLGVTIRSIPLLPGAPSPMAV